MTLPVIPRLEHSVRSLLTRRVLESSVAIHSFWLLCCFEHTKGFFCVFFLFFLGES